MSIPDENTTRKLCIPDKQFKIPKSMTIVRVRLSKVNILLTRLKESRLTEGTTKIRSRHIVPIAF